MTYGFLGSDEWFFSKKSDLVDISGDFETSAFKIKASAKAFDILSSNNLHP